MAKILLIMPPWYMFFGDGFNEIPSGLCSIAGYLNDKGHEAFVYNADFNPGHGKGIGDFLDNYENYQEELQNFNQPIWGKIGEQIEKMQPDIVGIHFKTGAYESVRHVARLTRTSSPKSLIIVGGPHPTVAPLETIRLPEIDIVVLGEGEITTSEIADRSSFDFEEKIPGALIKDNKGNIIDGGYRPFIEDLDDVGEPDREHLINHNKYSPYAFGVIFTARGCPYRCTYCVSKSIWSRKVRFRSPESIVTEIIHVHQRFGTKYFNFRDDTFTVDRKRTLEICRLIKKRCPKIAWRCDTRADRIDKDLAAAMRRAGCVQANVGIETGSSRILKMIKKGETLEQISNGVKALKKNKIGISAFVMMGFPTETKEDVEATLTFAIGLKPHSLVMSILTPYPGTEIHQQAKEQDILPIEVPYSAYFHQSPKMGLMNLPQQEFSQFKKEIFARVDKYNRSLWRKAHRFSLIFTQNPKASFERLISYIYN